MLPHPQLKAMLEALVPLSVSGKLVTVIDHSIPLDEIVAAHRYIGQEHKKGNVVLSFD